MIHSNEKVIKHKVGLLNLAEELGNVSKACKMMGLSRDTFYRYKAAADEGGVEALFDRNRRTPNLKNRVDPELEKAVLEYALEQPAHGQLRTSNELRKLGTFISPSGVRSIWLRHGLACFKDRLKALSDKVAKEGLILTEDQVAAMERKKHDDEACGEIETQHPGLPWFIRHLLRGHVQRHWSCLSTDLCGYVFKGRSCKALHDQNTDNCGRYAQ